MILSNRKRTCIATVAILALAFLLMPAISDEIPSSLALKLNRVRKALGAEKLDIISTWSTLEQRRYLLYVDMFRALPAKLYGDDTVETLVPADDLAIIKTWPADDQIKAAQYFKQKGPADGSDEISGEDLEKEIAKLEGEMRALIRLMLPSEQKGFFAVSNKSEAERKTAAPKPAAPPADPPAKAAPEPASSGTKPGASGGRLAGIIIGIAVLVAVTVGLLARKKPAVRDDKDQ